MSLAQNIDLDLPCAGCGYNLRSLSRDAVCTECGVPVARSVGRDNALREARPAWLQSLSIGIWIMLASQLLLAVAWATLVSARASAQTVLGVVIGLTALYAVGTWVLTRREQLYSRERRGNIVLRWIARIGVLGIPAAGGTIAWTMRSFQTMAFIWNIMGLAALVVPGVLATYLYLRTLAKRVLSRRLAEYAGIVAWGGAITAAVYLGYFANGFMEAGLKLSSTSGAIVMLAVSVAFLLFYLWSLVVLIMFAVALIKAARNARTMWNSETAFPAIST